MSDAVKGASHRVQDGSTSVLISSPVVVSWFDLLGQDSGEISWEEEAREGPLPTGCGCDCFQPRQPEKTRSYCEQAQNQYKAG